MQDVLAIVINGNPSTKTATGKRIQEFIIMDKLPSTKTVTGKLIQEFIIMDKLLQRFPLQVHQSNRNPDA
ncbi:hypothetical protein KY290_029750 [Solanum tuberosum]|uniref:Uncharacterized protein n=1 Tax=Solanum tuberosum TaxID=4113 RepID=A0ABQ7UNN9_SOLTU|nr:hypothetical protein KY285_028789 [Solanum tuberosum]KAH0750518.1 hypothetical protein KY290_029750 [Solanum tuberosum]